MASGSLQAADTLRASARWQGVRRIAGIADRTLGPQFASSAAYSIAGSVVSQLLSIISVWAAAMILGTDAFGRLAMVQNTTALLGTLFGVALATTATTYIPRLLSREPERAAGVISTCSSLAWIAGACMTVLLLVAAPAIAARLLGDPNLTPPLRLAAVAVCFQSVGSAQTGPLAGLQAFRAVAIGNAARGIASIALIPAAARLFGLTGAVCSYVAMSGLVCVANGALLRRELIRAGLHRFRPRAFGECSLFRKFSAPILLSSIVVGPALWFANALLVRQPNGFAELGMYAAAERWRVAIVFMPTCLATVALPGLSRSSMVPHQFKSHVVAYAFVVLALSATIAAPVIAFAPRIMSLLGPGFAGGGTMLRILALASIAVAANTALGQAMLSTEMAWARFTIDVTLAATFVALSAWLVPAWKADGMAAAYLFAYLAAVLILIAATPFTLRRAARRSS